MIGNSLIISVFQSWPQTAASCSTKERQTAESTLSSRTNPSHSTFTVKWEQVGAIMDAPALGMGHGQSKQKRPIKIGSAKVWGTVLTG